MSIPSGYKQVQIPNKSPQQLQYLQALLGQHQQYGPDATSYLGRLANGDDSAYQAMAQPAINTFNQQLLPGIAERFAGNGMLSSSSFQNAATGAAGNLAASLNSQRAEIQLKALQSLLGLGNDLLQQQPYQYGLQKKKGWWDYAREGIDTGAQIASGVAAFL